MHEDLSCDAVIPVHGVMLAAASPVFRVICETAVHDHNTTTSQATTTTTTTATTTTTTTTTTDTCRSNPIFINERGMIHITIHDSRLDHITMMRLIDAIYTQQIHVQQHVILQHINMISTTTTIPTPPLMTSAILTFESLPSMVTLSELSSLLYGAVKYDISSLITQLATAFTQLLSAAHTSTAKHTIRQLLQPYRACPSLAKLL